MATRGSGLISRAVTDTLTRLDDFNREIITLDLQEFGAVYGGVEDCTDAFIAAIAAAEKYVSENTIFDNRFGRGAIISCQGIAKVQANKLKIKKSNIFVKGTGGSFGLYSPNAAGDILTFDSESPLALYGCGVMDLHFDGGDNSTAGAALNCIRTISFHSDKLIMNGVFQDVKIDGGGRMEFGSIHTTQEVRKQGISGATVEILSTNHLSSDITFSQIFILHAVFAKPDWAIIINGCDGLYFNHGHIHGGVLIEPKDEGLKTTASIEFNNYYMDKTPQQNILIKGGAITYKNIYFNGICCRDGKGVEIATTTDVSIIQFNGGRISEAENTGIRSNQNAKRISVMGIAFESNNTDNSAMGGDVILGGENHQIIGATFEGGGVAGSAVDLSNASGSSVIGGSVKQSGSKKVVAGTNKIVSLDGYKNKNRGSATVVNGTKEIIVPHGLDSKIDANTLYDFQYSVRGSSGGGGALRVDDINDTNFKFMFEANVTQDVYISWAVDTE